VILRAVIKSMIGGDLQLFSKILNFIGKLDVLNCFFVDYPNICFLLFIYLS